MDGPDGLGLLGEAWALELGLAERVRTVRAGLVAAWPDLGRPGLVWASASMHHMAEPDRTPCTPPPREDRPDGRRGESARRPYGGSGGGGNPRFPRRAACSGTARPVAVRVAPAARVTGM